MTDLKPCPFCGGEAVESIAGVSCTKCGGTMHGGVQYGGADWDKVDEAWNTRADTFNREDVESAFVHGYSLGSLPVSESGGWDENEAELEEQMRYLGWVRERTCHETTIGEFWRGCSECDFIWDVFYSLGSKEKPNYCPNCGARVITDNEPVEVWRQASADDVTCYEEEQ